MCLRNKRNLIAVLAAFGIFTKPARSNCLLLTIQKPTSLPILHSERMHYIAFENTSNRSVQSSTILDKCTLAEVLENRVDEKNENINYL